MHYGNDLSFLAAAGIFPAQILFRAQAGCSRGAVLPKARKGTTVPMVNGSGCSPRGCGIRDKSGMGFRGLNCCPCCRSYPSSSRQGWHRSHSGAVPNLPAPFLLSQAPKGVQKEISSLFLGRWDSSWVFWCELELELQPLDMEHPQQSLRSGSEPQSSLTPVTPLTVSPQRGV